MKSKIKKAIPFAIIYFFVFDILAICKFFNVDESVQRIALLIAYPVISITSGFIFGLKNNFWWLFLLIPVTALAVRAILFGGWLYTLFLFMFIFVGFCMGSLMGAMNGE